MLTTTNPFLKQQNTLLSNTEEKRGGIFIFIWVIYLLLSPLYLFPSGSPQISDLVIFSGIFLLFSLTYSKHGSYDKDNILCVYIFGGIFVALTTTINMVHYFFTPDLRLILHAIIYLFNFFIFLFTLHLFKAHPKQTNQWTYIAIAAMCIGEFIYVAFIENITHRASGTFNGSNQLAYWGVLTTAILITLKRHTYFKLFDFFLIALIMYIEMKALSKAGMIVYVLILAIMVFTPNMSKTIRLFLGLCTLSLCVFLIHSPQRIFTTINNIQTFSTVIDRLNTFGKESDDSAQGRGYDRIIKYPEHVIFGAGEGAYWRFGKHELHSGIATLVFSYGVFGTILFVLFLGSIFYRLPWYYTMLLIPIFLYGLTHQHIRFSYFWVFLATSYSWHFFKHGPTSTKDNRTPSNQQQIPKELK